MKKLTILIAMLMATSVLGMELYLLIAKDKELRI
jgi:hypothetical protein